jgi:hypothetical protein
MDCLMVDSDNPGLGVCVPGFACTKGDSFRNAHSAIEEFLGGGHGVVGDFKVTGFDIDRDFLLFMRRVRNLVKIEII